MIGAPGDTVAVAAPRQGLPDEVVRRIVEGYGPVERILLFGSAARGEQDAWSDLDLIIIEQTSERFLRRLLAVPELPVEADVFVYTPEEFQRMLKSENPFLMSALKDAIVIYPGPHEASP